MKRVENSAEAVIVAEGNRSGLESEFPFFSSWKDRERGSHCWKIIQKVSFWNFMFIRFKHYLVQFSDTTMKKMRLFTRFSNTVFQEKRIEKEVFSELNTSGIAVSCRCNIAVVFTSFKESSTFASSFFGQLQVHLYSMRRQDHREKSLKEKNGFTR